MFSRARALLERENGDREGPGARAEARGVARAEGALPHLLVELPLGQHIVLFE